MLDHYIRDRKTLARLEGNPLRSFLEEAADRYRADGYAFTYARRSLGLALQFGDWLRTHRVPSDRITNTHIASFLRRFLPGLPASCSYQKKIAQAAIRFVLASVLNPTPPIMVPTPAQVEVARYIEHLRRNRGLAEGTMEHHQRNLEQFLSFYFKRRRVDLSAITAARIHAYVDGLPQDRCRSRRRATCTALRGYFRFLQLHGIATGHLQGMVPTVRQTRAALSPTWLTAADGAQVLRSVDRSRIAGKRNYAAILCMMDLGLRVGDVARLALDDIDWHAGTIRVANHKRGRPYRLPLPQRLGKALAHYLAKGRPPSPYREIFLSHGHPRGVPTTAAALKRMMGYAWKRAGLSQRFSGTHVLRHSLATRLTQEGVSLKLIADMLGHHAIQTTTLYAQVNLPALRTVAQPWPEVQP